jgi:hypothetical protein
MTTTMRINRAVAVLEPSKRMVSIDDGSGHRDVDESGLRALGAARRHARISLRPMGGSRVDDDPKIRL